MTLPRAEGAGSARVSGRSRQFLGTGQVDQAVIRANWRQRSKLRGDKLFVESREDIIKRIGRSLDYASAVILAMLDTPRSAPVTTWRTASGKQVKREYDPTEFMRRDRHDPFASPSSRRVRSFGAASCGPLFSSGSSAFLPSVLRMPRSSGSDRSSVQPFHANGPDRSLHALLAR